MQVHEGDQLKTMELCSRVAVEAEPRPPRPVSGSRLPVRGEPARPRLDSVDLLRGVVMVLMALDHTRDFFGGSAMNPRDVNDPALFLTRWVTHFCAPIFIFLAGISAFLYGRRGRSRRELCRYLFTRGAWLVLIELTVVNFGWTFDIAFDFFVLQVIWAIGWSMIVLAGLIHLPRGVIAALALAIVFGHNVFDGLEAGRFGALRWLWLVLHEPGILSPVDGVKVFALYPLVPWIGVMAAGYAFGPVMLFPERERRSWLLRSGVVLVGVFVGLRAVNLYGDPAPWQLQEGWAASLLSFINCEKYPPSLLYLAMTLGPALLALGWFERVRGRVSQWLITFGRVPLLYYVAHIYLIHLLVVAAAVAVGGDLGWLFQDLSARPPDYGFSLPVVYALWLGIVLSLYPLCRWFAKLRRRRNDWWLSYL